MMKSRAITLGCLSAFVVLGGTIVSVLLHQMIKTVADGYQYNSETKWQALSQAQGPIWALGLVFVFPGILGFISALVQNKCMYVTTCVFSIISIVIIGILFVFAGFAIVLLIIALGVIEDQCYDAYDGCQCRVEDNYEGTAYTTTPFRTCDSLTTFTALCIALLVMLIVAWIALLCMCILVIYYSCRSETHAQGTVLVPAQQPMLPPEQWGSAQPPPPGYAYPPPPQQYYDQPPPSKV